MNDLSPQSLVHAADSSVMLVGVVSFCPIYSRSGGNSHQVPSRVIQLAVLRTERLAGGDTSPCGKIFSIGENVDAGIRAASEVSHGWPLAWHLVVGPEMLGLLSPPWLSVAHVPNISINVLVDLALRLV
jgi:hypothetical protein